MKSGKILGGLAILEDANHNTAQLTAVPVDEMEHARKRNCSRWQNRGWAAFPSPLNILILDEIGKNYSGAGMDTKVVNRGVNGESNLWDTAPHIDRIFIRGLSDHSYGNGVGLGMADVVHDRLLAAIDWHPTHINSLTASTPTAIRTPIHFSTDRECLERIWPTCGVHRQKEIRLGWIANSLDIAEMRVTENLRAEIESNPNLEIVGSAEELDFDAGGNLTGLLETASVAH